MKKTIILGSNKSVDEYAALLRDSKDVELTGYIDPDDSLNTICLVILLKYWKSYKPAIIHHWKPSEKCIV
jgi:hypothetical protein